MRKFRLNLSLFKVWVWAETPFVKQLKILEYLGVLEVKQGLGTFVRTKNDFSIVINSIHHSDLYEHVEVRCLLEIEIAKLAARYSTPEDMRDVIAF